jgi:hypothetical protein
VGFPTECSFFISFAFKPSTDLIMRICAVLHFAIVSCLGLAKEFPAEINPKKSIRLTTLYSSGEPGVERQFDPSTAAVTLRARVERVGLDSEEAVERLKELVSKNRYSERTKSISFTVKDFPLQALNKKRALEILNELIAECKMQPTMAPEGEAATPSEANASEVKPLRRRRQISLAFPKEWLPKVAQ